MLRHESAVGCPYCGESITLFIEDSDIGIDYTEDCSVCCRPMVVSVRPGEMGEMGEPVADVRREDE